MRKTALILGGTGDARKIADHFVELHNDQLRVITSLAGRTSSPRKPKGEIREGGFGGAEGLAAYLNETPVDVLVDATHPYAAQISEHAIKAASITNTPLLHFSRPEWVPEPDDNWLHVSDITAAAATLSQHASKAMITTGIQNLDVFKPVTEVKLFVRLLEHPKSEISFSNTEIVIGHPPYTLDGELALFQLLGIDTLVTKNAGGDATIAKIKAARTLGLQVVMIDRPGPPYQNVVRDISDVIKQTSLILKFDSD